MQIRKTDITIGSKGPYGATTWNEIIPYCGMSSFPGMEISGGFHSNWEGMKRFISLKVFPSGFLKY